jgi:hypothetical protein
MDEPTYYIIRIEGHISASWASWFEGLEIRREESGETVLSGTLVDQTALHGVLMRIRDLGLPLVAVSRLREAADQEPDAQRVEEGNV